MKKIKITEAQLKRIVETIDNKEPEVIDEGYFGNLAAAVMFLAGVSGGVKAQDANKLPFPAEKKEMVIKALADPAVISQLEELGVNDNNVQKALDKLKNLPADKVYVSKPIKTSDRDVVSKKLQTGSYMLTKAEAKEVYDTLKNNVNSEATILTFDFYFDVGSYDFKEADVIKDSLKSIENQNGILLSVKIESSTDKQGLRKEKEEELKNLGYNQGGNIALSAARNDVVKKAFTENGVDPELIKRDYEFEQGPGQTGQAPVVDGGLSSRYVKIEIIYTVAPEDVITKSTEVEYELIRYGERVKPKKDNFGWTKNVKNFKSSVRKLHDCPVW
jgi:outer membrane protein OmpA-like peptidoglycan-associated protein